MVRTYALVLLHTYMSRMDVCTACTCMCNMYHGAGTYVCKNVCVCMYVCMYVCRATQLGTGTMPASQTVTRSIRRRSRSQWGAVLGAGCVNTPTVRTAISSAMTDRLLQELNFVVVRELVQFRAHCMHFALQFARLHSGGHLVVSKARKVGSRSCLLYTSPSPRDRG